MSAPDILDGRAEIYERLLNDSPFLNDLWDSLGATDKVSILEKAGWNLVEEYTKNQDIDLNNKHDN